MKAAQKEVSAVIENLNSEDFNLMEETSLLAGLKETSEFICEGECQGIDRIEEICKEANKPGEGGETDCPKGKRGNQANDTGHGRTPTMGDSARRAAVA